MSGKTISQSETKVEALRLQSSAYGVTIPLAFGVTRISGNLVDYLGFTAVPHTETQGGKGGGVKVKSTTFTYKADVVMGLCHGPITEVPRIWRGKKLFEGGWLPSQIVSTNETYTPPASGPMQYTVSNAASFVGGVSVAVLELEEGWTGSVDPSYYQRWVAIGVAYTASATGVVTILDETMRGRELTISYQHTTGARPPTAMDKLGLSFKAGTIGQTAWGALPSGRDVPYSGLALVAGQGYDLGDGAQVENHMFEVVGPMAYTLGASVPDVDPAPMLRATLTQLQGGAGFPAQHLDDWTAWSTYCRASGLLVSPAMTEQSSAAEIVRMAGRLTNAAPVWSGGRLKMVPLADQAETGNGATYTPDNTPVYALDDESYTPASTGESPVRVRLKSSAERYNHWRVEFLNRGNQYNVEIAEAKDAADIDTHGLRSAEIVKAHWICLPAAARKVAQTLLQRSLYVVAEYQVPLPCHYALIEPADLLTLTDNTLQMQSLPVRVTVVEENEDGDLTITAEDYPPGTASAAAYPTQAGSGYTANYNADPGDVDTPAIFEAPYTLAVTGLEVYAAVRGLSSIWGGCQVWVSLDGDTYQYMGVVYGASRYGTLSADITSSSTSLGVEGLGANAQLLSGSAEDAEALQTLCYVGGAAEEYLAYQGATLTGAGAYTLGGLVRGAHGTTPAAHDEGATFVRVDERIAKSGALERVLIGKTISFKFLSFNIWGGGQQQLEDATAWPYTITGGMVDLEPEVGAPPALVLSPALITLQADASGIVTDWSGAVSVASVRSASGADVSSEWAFSLAAYGVVAAASGAYGNTITLSAFDAALAASSYNAVLLQLHLDGDFTDTSKYRRTPSYTGSGLSFTTGDGGAFGEAMEVSSANASNGRLRFTDPAFRVLGGATWSMRCKVRVTAGPASNGYSHYILGSDYRSIQLIKQLSGLELRAEWIAQGATVSAQTSSNAVPLATWIDIEAAYGSDRVLRLFINGTKVAESLPQAAGLTDFIVAETANFSAGCSFGTEASNVALNGRIDEVRYMVGAPVPEANYTVAGTPYVDGPYLASAWVDVTATKAGASDLVARLNVQTVASAQAVVTSSISVPTITLQADWQGVVSSYTGASTTVSVRIDGVESVSAWAAAVTPSDAGITYSYTAGTGVLAITAMPTALASGHIDILLTRAQRPAQQLRVNVAKALSPKPAQTSSITPGVIVLQADANGIVASYTGAACTGAMFEGGAAASGWAWSHTASAGLTVSRTDGTVTITAMADDVDAGTITLTATKTGWTTTTLTCTVTKVRAGRERGGNFDSAGTTFSPADASARLEWRTDGTIYAQENGGTAAKVGDWYLPTTAGIGSSYKIRFDLVQSTGASGGESGDAASAWHTISSHRGITLTTSENTSGLFRQRTYAYTIRRLSDDVQVANGVKYLEAAIEA